MSEKRVFVAAIISVVFFGLYTQYLVKRYPSLSKTTKPVPAATSTAMPETPAPAASSSGLPALVDNESTFVLSSSVLSIEMGEVSGSARTVTLTGYKDDEGRAGVRFATDHPISYLDFGTEATWSLISKDASQAAFRVSQPDNCAHEVRYSLDPKQPVMEASVSSTGCGESAELIVRNSWGKSTAHSSVDNVFQWDALTYKEPGIGSKYVQKKGHLKKPFGVPRGTAQVTLSERYFCQSVKSAAGLGQASLLSPGTTSSAAEMRFPLDADGKRVLQFYYGSRDYFHLESAGFAQAFHIGILGRIGLILLAMLSWIAGVTTNYGVAIIVFSALITLLMAPFTLISLRSMKKMQELQPHIKRIMDKHKDDQVKANQEVFGLYKEHKVSPLSGCLPLLLQWPILIALLQAITSYTDLRGKPFLWVRDLSLPDRIAQLPFSLPFLGSDVNLLPVLMSLAMFVQTKISQRNAVVDKSNPSTAMLSGPMLPIIFGVMLYHVPAGLVLYWLSNSVLGSLLYAKVMGSSSAVAAKA